MTSHTLIALLAVGVIARARTPRKPIVVTPEQLNVASIPLNSPADGSPLAKAELAEVHRLQHSRQSVEIAHAKADDTEEDMFIFKDIRGEKFTAAALPATALLSSHLHNSEGLIDTTP